MALPRVAGDYRKSVDTALFVDLPVEYPVSKNKVVNNGKNACSAEGKIRIGTPLPH
jgi:hypothetical protein